MAARSAVLGGTEATEATGLVSTATPLSAEVWMQGWPRCVRVFQRLASGMV